MSRRKQSNPKPLLKSDCQDTAEEMTVERDNKDFSNSETNEEVAVADIEISDNFSVEQINDRSSSPKLKINSDTNVKPSQNSNSDEPQNSIVPKLRLNISLASDPALKPEAKDIKIIHSGDVSDDNMKTNDVDDETGLLRGQLKSPSVDIAQRMKVFMCHPCGIGFSSLSTLEAHQTYYCSHRKDIDEEVSSNNISASDKTSTGEPSTKSIKTGKQYACTQCSYSADKKVSLNRHMRMHQSSPAPSSNVSNGDESSSQQIDRYCSECDIRFSNIKTYRAHKQHYCNSRRTDGQNATPKPELKKSGSVSPQERSKTPTPAAPPQPFVALPTNPILIIPYSIVRAASLLPGPLTSVTTGITNPNTTCFSFENGTLQPLATAINSQGLTDSVTTRVQANSTVTSTLLTEKNARTPNSENSKLSKKEGTSRETVPLDLSVRKSPIYKQRQRSGTHSPATSEENNKIDIEAMMEGKENVSIASGKMTPEQIVCAPSLPNSPSLSPSPRRRTASPKGFSVSVSPSPLSSEHVTMRSLLPTDLAFKLSESNLIPSLISKQNAELTIKLGASGSKINENSNSLNSQLLSLPGAPSISIVPPISNVQPQIYVKQGVSKCKECNIVFCKFENYLAHKQHYCSARNQDDAETKITTPPIQGNQSDSGPPPIAYHQLICAACGIKYTSLDNLRAHQTFYCPKGGELSAQIAIGKEKCVKCKIIHEVGQQCPVVQGSYKCPVCDLVSLTVTDSRKHLETHGSVKAFRCSICRYKGNTLRGMRTHIRMHFDKKTSDFNEENYMSCILEEDGVEIQSPAINVNQDLHSQQQLFNCDICNYSSSYKGNVMRHMKLVHSQQLTPTSNSPDIGEGGESLLQNGDTNSNNSKSEENMVVKLEPPEIKTNDKEYYPDEGVSNMKIESEDNKNQSDISMSVISSSCTPPLTAEENTLKGIVGPPKYCQTCDIKFNYMNTYIAHKQFYCKSARNERESPSPVPVQSPAALINKNKENVETVL